MAGYRGATPLGDLYRGGVKLGAGWTYRDGQWVQVYASWKDSGVECAAFTVPDEDVWDTVTGWTVMASYPGTQITGDGIAIEPGTYTITAGATNNRQASYGEVRVCLDGTPIPGLHDAGGGVGGGQPYTEGTVTLGAGVVTLQVMANNTYFGQGLDFSSIALTVSAA